MLILTITLQSNEFSILLIHKLNQGIEAQGILPDWSHERGYFIVSSILCNLKDYSISKEWGP